MKQARGFGLLVLSAAIFLAPALCAAAELSAVPVAEKLFLIKGTEGGNVAFLVTDGGVLVVDSGSSPAEGKAIVEKIASLTGKPIRYVVLTHYHGDHTFGLQAYPESAVIIGHRNLAVNIRKFTEPRIKDSIERRIPDMINASRQIIAKLKKGRELAKEQEKLKGLEERLAELKELRIVYPEISYEGLLRISLGGGQVELIYPGGAHTNCNSLVYFPDQKAIVVGDMLFAGMVPYIDWQAGSDTANWIDKIKEVASLQVEKVIPGHGELTDLAGLLKQAAYLSDLRAAVQRAIASGETLEKMKKSVILADWKELQGLERLSTNIEAVYNELKK